jgi:hypothetical protein
LGFNPNKERAKAQQHKERAKAQQHKERAKAQQRKDLLIVLKDIENDLNSRKNPR